MKNTFITMLVLVGNTHAAFGMPCDTGFICTSKTYRIELQACRYVNSIGLNSLQMKGIESKDAKLGPAYDGTSGGGPLSFEITLPLSLQDEEQGSARVLSVEIPSHRLRGIVKEKFAREQPSPFLLVRQESIQCVKSE